MFVKYCDPDVEDEVLKTLEDNMNQFSTEVQMKIVEREQLIAQLKYNVKPPPKKIVAKKW